MGLLESSIFWPAVGCFTVGVLYSSYFEWTLHRYFMHRPFGGFDYAFRALTLLHHHVFQSDHTCHGINEKDKEIIPLAWWNGPLLIFLGMLPKARRVEKSWIFYRLNGHHLPHHQYMHKNYNVVMPFADLCLGTLMLCSKIKFRRRAARPSLTSSQG